MAQSSHNTGLGPLTLVGVGVMIIAAIVLQIFLRTTDHDNNRIQHTDFGAFINSALDVTSSRSSAQSSLPDDVIVASPFQFTGRNSQSVQAWLSKPAGHTTTVAIVIIPDTSNGTYTAAHVAQTLGAALSDTAHVVTVTVDLPSDSALSDQLTTIVSTVDYLRATTEFQDGGVVLMGTGLGAYQAFQASATVAVDGLVSVGGFAEPAAVYAQLQKNNPESADQFVRIMGCNTASVIEACLQQLSIVDAVQPAVPTVIIQTNNDPLTPSDQAQVLSQQLLPALVTTVTIPTTTVVHDVLASSTTEGYGTAWSGLVAWLNQQSQAAAQRRAGQ